MTDNLDLARRAVACKHFRWMPGMLMLKAGVDWRIIDPDLRMDGDELPDLSDPATIGCLLALVREAWHDPFVTVDGTPVPESKDAKDQWQIFTSQMRRISRGETEAAALVAALEAAP